MTEKERIEKRVQRLILAMELSGLVDLLGKRDDSRKVRIIRPRIRKSK